MAMSWISYLFSAHILLLVGYRLLQWAGGRRQGFSFRLLLIQGYLFCFLAVTLPGLFMVMKSEKKVATIVRVWDNSIDLALEVVP